jgi:hypothetical protein
MSIVLVGSTSGSVTLQEPAVAGTTVLTLPAVTGNVLTDTSPKAGNVIQVVNSVRTTDTSTTSTSYVTTGHAVTITPSSSSSKVLVFLNGGGGFTSNGSSLKLTIYRGATDIAPAYNLMSNTYSSASADFFVNHSLCVLDSPATTSATTYTVYFKTNTGTINYAWSDKGIPSLTAMEIAG